MTMLILYKIDFKIKFFSRDKEQVIMIKGSILQEAIIIITQTRPFVPSSFSPIGEKKNYIKEKIYTYTPNVFQVWNKMQIFT